MGVGGEGECGCSENEKWVELHKERSYQLWITRAGWIALETLRYFAHLPKAILTNGPSDVQRAAIRASGLEDFFQTILVSGDADIGFAKPHLRMFELACERLEVTPTETLMIGDRLDLDVQAAIAAGLQAIHKPEQSP